MPATLEAIRAGVGIAAAWQAADRRLTAAAEPAAATFEAAETLQPSQGALETRQDEQPA